MRNTLLLFVILFTTSLFSQNTEINLKFNQNQFQVKQTAFSYQGNYTSEIIATDKNFSYKISNVGEPALPTYTINVAVPYGAEFRNVNINYQTEAFNNNIVVEPTQPQIPLSQTERPERTEPKASVYSSSNTYPSNIVEYLGTSLMNQYEYFTFSVSPLIYNPASKSIEIITNISITIDYTGTTRTAKGKDDGSFHNLMKSLVVNPNDVEHSSSLRSPTDANDVKYLIITTDYC